jgi:Secretion system C-terminal sorting domain
MKKAILLFAAALLIGNFSRAQSFSLSEPGPITIIGELPEDILYGLMETIHVDVTNISSTTKNVKVERTIIDTVAGTDFYYCWAQCYSATACQNNAVITNAESVELEAAETTNLFGAYYRPKGMVGVNTVEYCFFDVNNTSDRVCLVASHDAREAVSILEVTGVTNFLSAPQPNPASGLTKIVYNLPNLNNGKLVVRNMLGSTIKEIQLDKVSDSKTIDVSLFNAGIYFYSLVNNGNIISSQRLVVK